MSPGFANFMIKSALNSNDSPSQKIVFIIACMESKDWTVQQEIHSVINSKYPQFKKILKNPEKYKSLL